MIKFYSFSMIIMMMIGLASCATKLYQSADEYSKVFISGSLTQCGHVKYREASDEVKSCIFSSLKKSTPFYTWFWLRPVDSTPATGLILNQNKELFITWYDSDAKFTRSFFRTTKCSTWELEQLGRQRVICKVGSKEKIYLFDLESFVVVSINDNQ